MVVDADLVAGRASIAWQYKHDTDTDVMNPDGSSKRRIFQNWDAFVDTYDWRATN